MSPPRPELVSFVQRRWPGANAVELAGDASTRRFFRVRQGGASRVLMDYGEPCDARTTDVRLTRIFQDAGLPVPAILEVVPEVGCLVLQDLGDRTLERELRGAPDKRRERYASAVDLARRIAVEGSPVLAGSDRAEGPRLDAARFRFELEFFLEHYVVGLLGRTEAAAELRGPLEALAETAAGGTPVLCHRDFHCRNLLVDDDESIWMVDIQDAQWGPDGYDLASLLNDAYVDIEAAWIPELVERFLVGHPAGDDRDRFLERFDRVAIQRMLKALGTFGYQATVRGKRRYLEAVPRTLSRLGRLLPVRPELAALDRGLRANGLLTALPNQPR